MKFLQSRFLSLKKNKKVNIFVGKKKKNFIKNTNTVTHQLKKKNKKLSSVVYQGAKNC